MCTALLRPSRARISRIPFRQPPLPLVQDMQERDGASSRARRRKRCLAPTSSCTRRHIWISPRQVASVMVHTLETYSWREGMLPWLTHNMLWLGTCQKDFSSPSQPRKRSCNSKLPARSDQVMLATTRRRRRLLSKECASFLLIHCIYKLIPCHCFRVPWA